MKTKRVRKTFSVLLAMAILVSLAVMPQIASAETEYVEELIYSQDFSNFTEADYVKADYTADTYEAGKWYIGKAGRVMSHNFAFGAFAKGESGKYISVPYMFPSSFDNTQNEYDIEFNYKNTQWVTTIRLIDSAGGVIEIIPNGWGTTGTYYSIKLTINDTKCLVYRNGSLDRTIDISGKKIVGMYMNVYGNAATYAKSYGWIDDIVVKQGDTVIASENFDDWQRADINAELEAMKVYKAPYTDTTPSLYARADGADKCVATQWHYKGTDEYITFTFPEVMSSGKYKITFDRFMSGNWCDWLYVGKSSGATGVNINGTQSAWLASTVDIDIDNGTWSHNNYSSGMTVDNTTNRIMFRMHSNAAHGVEMLIDNFKIYKLVEATESELTTDTLSISSYEFIDDIGLPLFAVPKSGTIFANVVLGINTPGNYDFSAIIATYAEDGSLLDVKVEPVSVKLSDTSKIVPFEIGATADTYSCKVFFWNMAESAITPLTETVAFPAN